MAKFHVDQRVRLAPEHGLLGVPTGMHGTVVEVHENTVGPPHYRVRYDRQPWDLPANGIITMERELEESS